MAVTTCACGHELGVHNGVRTCPHCDEACLPGGFGYCRWCVAYGAAVNMRVVTEHETERKAKGNG